MTVLRRRTGVGLLLAGWVEVETLKWACSLTDIIMPTAEMEVMLPGWLREMPPDPEMEYLLTIRDEYDGWTEAGLIRIPMNEEYREAFN